MLTQMRKPVAKVITVALFGLLILSFAVWGIGDIFRSGGTVVAVAEVGGTEINQVEFSRDLSREMSRLRQQFGGQFDIQQAQAFGIVDQVLDQLITRSAFDQQASDMGMLVSDDQIRERIVSEPAFQNDFGDFDKARFFQILRNVGQSEQQFVMSIGRDINRQQMIEAVGGAVPAPRALAETLYKYQQEKRVAERLTVTFDGLPALPEPTDEQLETVHKDHAGRFQSPEYRAVNLIQLQADVFAEEVSVADQDVREEFESRREEFRVPERRALRQIVLFDKAQADDAKAKLAAGQSFEEVSQALLSRDPVDLGTMSADELAGQLPAVAEAAFALEENGLSDPVESPFGWHILQITAVEPGEEPNFDAAREDLEQEIAMRSAVDSMVSIANELDDELGSGATLEEAAEALGLEIRSIAAIDASGRDPEDNVVEDLPPVDEFAPVVFQTEPGDDSLLNETRDGDYFVIRVVSISPAATLPLAEVRDDVAELWRELERDRLARERADALAQRVRDGEDLKSVAEAEGLSYATTEPIAREESGGVEPALRDLAAKMFDLAPDDVTTASAPEGYLVARVTEIQPVEPSADPEAVDRIQEFLDRDLRADLLTGFINAMREDFGVKINPRVIQNTISSF